MPFSNDAPARGFVPPSIKEAVVPPLVLGAYCGAAGAFLGSGAATFTGRNPVLSGAATGIQWGMLGSTYWFSRQMTLRAMGASENPTNGQKLQASGLASVPASVVMILGFGPYMRSNIVSSFTLCGVAAVGGQFAIDWYRQLPERPVDEDRSWMNSRFSPLKKMSDKEYTDMLSEKLLRVDADIALIDERIEKLREQAAFEGAPAERPK
ncbi:uncharacterized protein F5Z01DRAFT_656707 [Emericellopsis atlantica]|uniref:Uncharacterized protein n=1 Tax=Emericellopsis atlantica TaxID=2614577 RepID=A0A9P7ZLA4_9HYPO|nr:uncharacterized protein F5Z01DRAFT_656707 [Emericellopsis atlantica]KAG9253787.1 hypothetical protein F5Z01DRAFT_656707 [Emericellopsis atlantica]